MSPSERFLPLVFRRKSSTTSGKLCPSPRGIHSHPKIHPLPPPGRIHPTSGPFRKGSCETGNNVYWCPHVPWQLGGQGAVQSGSLEGELRVLTCFRNTHSLQGRPMTPAPTTHPSGTNICAHGQSKALTQEENIFWNHCNFSCHRVRKSHYYTDISYTHILGGHFLG